MEYRKELQLKDGRVLIVRQVEPEEAAEERACFRQTHAETPYLTSYPDEPTHTTEEMAEKLAMFKASPLHYEVGAYVDGVLVGSGGIHPVSVRDKLKHRCEFGISILRDYWGLGIGTALMEACIEAAKMAGFLQMNLEMVEGNSAANHLYQKYGFIEYGRYPKGFRTRDGQWQELVYMYKDL